MYDRSYMSTSFEEKAKKTLYWILGLNVGIFVLQNSLLVFVGQDYLSSAFALRHDSLLRGMLWTPITYSFLHDTGGFLHILGNMLGVFFLGRAVLPVLGQKRFLQLYLGSAAAGGLLWFAVSFLSGANSVVGASAAVFALLSFFACLYPDREITFLLFFILPLRVRPRIIAYVFLGISVLGMLFQEMFRQGTMLVAHSAHLGGMIAGYLYYKYVYSANPYDNRGTLSLSLARFFKKPTTAKSSAGYRYNVNITPSTRDLQKEVDRILDKINSKGFGSLTPSEKKALDEARDLLRKR